jgi:hypothetical protein
MNEDFFEQAVDAAMSLIFLSFACVASSGAAFVVISLLDWVMTR